MQSVLTAFRLARVCIDLKGQNTKAHRGIAANKVINCRVPQPKAGVFVPGSLRAERALECVQLAAALSKAACRRSYDIDSTASFVAIRWARGAAIVLLPRKGHRK